MSCAIQSYWTLSGYVKGACSICRGYRKALWQILMLICR
jgi:hypothetical protein